MITTNFLITQEKKGVIMEEAFIREGTHIRYVNERIMIFSESKTILPMKLNTILIQLLLILINESRISVIKKIMYEQYSIAVDEIDMALQLLIPYLCDKNCKIEKSFSQELHRALISLKYNEYAINKQPYEILKKSHPELLSILLTHSCSRRCIYCYAGSIYDSNYQCSECMDFKLFQNIIRQAKILCVKQVELSGGDPFTINNIDEYVKCVIENKMDCFISTKHLVTMEMVDKLYKAGLRKIQISLDSSDERVADKLMGTLGAFKEVLQTIRNFRAYNFKITIRCVILKQNIDTIPSLIELCAAEGVNTISFNMYGMSCGRHNDNFFASEADIIELSNKIDKIKKTTINIYIDYLSGEIIQFAKSRSYGMKYKHYSRGTCGAMKASLTIRSDGKAVYCANLSDIDEVVIGDLNKQSIIEIWDESSYSHLAYPLIKYFEGTQCENCSDFEFCRNKRCYFRVWLAYGRLFDKDPLCKYGDETFKTY